MAEEYIKRSDAIKVVKAACEACTWNLSGHRIDSFPVCRRCYAPVTEININEIPAEDVAPVKHGEWISPPRREENKDYRNGDAIFYECSECGFVEDYRAKYCAWCGARMDGE